MNLHHTLTQHLPSKLFEDQRKIQEMLCLWEKQKSKDQLLIIRNKGQDNSMISEGLDMEEVHSFTYLND